MKSRTIALIVIRLFCFYLLVNALPGFIYGLQLTAPGYEESRPYYIYGSGASLAVCILLWFLGPVMARGIKDDSGELAEKTDYAEIIAIGIGLIGVLTLSWAIKDLIYCWTNASMLKQFYPALSQFVREDLSIWNTVWYLVVGVCFVLMAPRIAIALENAFVGKREKTDE